MIYYAKAAPARRRLRVVTASHNPAAVNGLKWLIGDEPPRPEEVAALQRSEAESVGDGAVRAVDHAAAARHFVRLRGLPARDVRRLFDRPAARGARPDARLLGGAGGRYLHAIFPQCVFSTIHDTRRRRVWRPHPRLLAAAQRWRAVRRGVPRAGGTGHRFRRRRRPHRPGRQRRRRPQRRRGHLGAADCLRDELRGDRFVYDLKFSDHLAEAARQLGAEPLRERSGHAFLRARMRESGAAFGAEVSGHYFYRGLSGGDDALYTACLLIEHLARGGGTLAQLRRGCPPVYMTPDLRVTMAPADQPAILEKVRAAWSSFPQSFVGRRADRHARGLGAGAQLGDRAGADIPFRGPRLARARGPGGALLRCIARVRRRVVDALPGGDGQ